MARFDRSLLNLVQRVDFFGWAVQFLTERSHLQGRNRSRIMRKFIEKGSQTGEPHTTLDKILPIQ
jgi:hypothetical protein